MDTIAFRIRLNSFPHFDFADSAKIEIVLTNETIPYMILNIAILLTVVVVAFLLLQPRLRTIPAWMAMTTPLASIIGSGFLVLGPILDSAYGAYAPLAMAALCIGAYAFGSAIRYNMRVFETGAPEPRPVVLLDRLGSWTLGFAYVISVAYYLNLFGAFAVSLTPLADPFSARMVTTAVFVLIVLVGWSGGFKSLEWMEYFSVTTKLAIISGLLVGLALYFHARATDNGLIFNQPSMSGWGAVTLGFGLIVTVQGFETSRYLGNTYDLKTRLKSMRWAQWLSSAIYLLYILLMAYVFERGQLKTTETAIVDMMGLVAPILSVLLVAAALAAQFSAAVADTSGSGGLVWQLSGKRISPRIAYAILAAIGIGITWIADVFEIIAYASRAFALYYTMEAGLAALNAWRQEERAKAVPFALLAVLGVAIVFLGQPFESGG